MSRGQVFSLWLAAGFFILLAVYPASAETVTDGTSPEYEEGKINLTEYSANSYNETESIETELGLGFKFLKSMLSLLHLNLNLINETLSERSEEYPFLQPTIEGTSTGINAVNSTIDFVDDPTNMSKANATMHTFDNAIEDLNASLVYPQDMLMLQCNLGALKPTPILETCTE